MSLNTFYVCFMLLSSLVSSGQSRGIDSLKVILYQQKEDTNKVKLLYNLSFAYTGGSYADTAFVYAQQALSLAEKLEYEKGIFWSEISLGGSLGVLGNYPQALEHNFKALALAQKIDRPLELCYGNGSLAETYYYMGDYNTSLKYVREVLRIGDEILRAQKDIYWMWIYMSRAFHGLEQSDSAMLYARKAYKMINQGDYLHARSVICPIIGNAYAGKGIYDSALLHYRLGIPISIKSHTETVLVDNYYGIADVYRKTGRMDSSLWYSKKILSEKVARSYPSGLLKAANMLSDIYQSQSKPDSALKYLKISIALKDSLFNREKTIAVQNQIYKDQEKQKALDSVTTQFRSQLIMYSFFAFLITSFIVAGIILKNRRQKQLQDMRNSIADDLHDDIGSTLSSINIMSELAKNKSQEASALLSAIGEGTVSMQENMSDIVWAIKSENESFENVLQRMTHFAMEILDAKNIHLDLDVDPSLPTVSLTIRQRKNLYLFFKEVINNAAKHSGAKKISVNILQKNRHVEMVIRDDGTGFVPDQTFNGNGMSSLKKRAEELSACYTLQSNLTEGTVVVLKFKIT